MNYRPLIHSESAACLKQAYAFCLQTTRRHYENFPVAAIFLPKDLKLAIASIYAFARTADDLVDEPNPDTTLEEKKQILALFRSQLGNPQLVSSETPSNQPNHHFIFTALNHTIEHYQLPLVLFYQLLEAFEQDLSVSHYHSYEALLQYCGRSANPIGRLLLHLVGNPQPRGLILSDLLCSGLQLINCIQDLDADIQIRGRHYFPAHEPLDLQITRAESLILASEALPTHIPHWGLKIQTKLLLHWAKVMIKRLKIKKTAEKKPLIKWQNFWIKFF